MNGRGYRFRPLTDADARAIAAWRYDGPLAFYDMDETATPGLLDPANAYLAVDDAAGELAGFVGFGPDGRVPGGERAGLYGGDALDVALGLRPDRVGQGHGAAFVSAALAEGRRRHAPVAFRLSVAEFNTRAIRAYARCGFREVARFTSPVRDDEVPFVLMTRDAANGSTTPA